MAGIRDSPAGALIRSMNPKWLPYPEEDGCYPDDFCWKSKEKGEGEDLGSDESTILCDWYDENESENPKNWPLARKLWVLLNVAACCFVVYMAGPIWTPGEDAFMQEFGTNYEYTTLGLGLFVLAYGIGPLLWSPLSEVPRIGRNQPYIYTFVAFTLVTIPTALVRNAPAFMFFRFLQGFFGSPILATGGATIADTFTDAYMPVAMTTWAAAAFAAPTVGPIIAGAAIPSLGWRFSIWEILIMSGPVVLMLLFLPETSSATILYRRAERLRKATGNNNIRSSSEIAQAGVDFRTVVIEALLIPTKITTLDPAILFVNIYLCLIYGIYYSFFESFPIVFTDMYNFTILQFGLAFIPLLIGTIIGFLAYLTYLLHVRVPKIRAGETMIPEQFLIPALFACFSPPVALFLFGWSSNPNVHWIVPMIGIAMYPMGVFVIFQSLFVYLAVCYPRFSASLFAASAFTRCTFSLGAVLFARPLFVRLGIGGGCSLLAGLMICCILGMFAIHRYGAALRARSKFAAKW